MHGHQRRIGLRRLMQDRMTGLLHQAFELLNQCGRQLGRVTRLIQQQETGPVVTRCRQSMLHFQQVHTQGRGVLRALCSGPEVFENVRGAI